MKAFICLLAFAVTGCAQSFHIIRVIPSGSTQGEIDLGSAKVRPDSTGTQTEVVGALSGNVGPLKVISTASSQGCADFYVSITTTGDTQENSICAGTGFPFVLRANTGNPVITVDHSGNSIFGRSDDAYLAVDAAGSARLGFTKQSGFIPRLTYGNGQNFEVAQSSAADIGAGNTFTVHFALNQTSGAPSLTFSDSTTGAIFSQGGSGHTITASEATTSSVLDIANTSSGGGITLSTNTGVGITALSASNTGVWGQSNATNGIGVLGQSQLSPLTSGIGVKGIGTGSSGIGVWAVATGSGVLTGGTALFAEDSATGGLAGHFGAGNVQIDNSLTVDNNLTVTLGNLSGAHLQNVGSADGPSFAQVGLSDSASAGVNREINWFTSGTLRWWLGLTGSESGSNVGSDLLLQRWSDGGSVLGTPFSVARSTGLVSIPNISLTTVSTPSVVSMSGSGFTVLQVTGGGSTTGISASSGTIAVSASSSGSIAVLGHNTGSGDGVDATSSSGIGLFASSTSGLAAQFHTGNVQIDHDLTVSGALTVSSCTGCGGGGVTSIASSGNGLSFSASTGAVTASLAQDISTTASPSFNAMSVGGSAFVDSSRNIQNASSFSLPGFTVIDASANLAGNSLLLTGITTGSGGVMVCASSTHVLYLSSGGVC